MTEPERPPLSFADHAEQAANQHELQSAEQLATAELWALKGKPAVTSLLAEGLLAASRLSQSKAYRAGDEGLNEQGRMIYAGVQQVFSLSGVYDTKIYGYARKNTKSVPRKLRKGDASLPWLADPALQDVHAEIGLAILSDTVSNIKEKGVFYGDVDRKKDLKSRYAAMQLNGSMDADVSAALMALRKSGEYSDVDFARSVVELAHLTAGEVQRNTALTKRYEQSAGLRRLIRKII